MVNFPVDVRKNLKGIILNENKNENENISEKIQQPEPPRNTEINAKDDSAEGKLSEIGECIALATHITSHKCCRECIINQIIWTLNHYLV